MENIPQFSFITSLSHELKTPLNGILGYCQLLSQTKLDDNQQLYVSNAGNCCIQLAEIINDILDFSKLVAGKGQINNQCFSFKEVTEEINSVIGQRLKEKRQKLKYVISKNLPEYISCDKQKIVQILINLLSNSNKFTPLGGRIIINIENKDNNFLECCVEDNGIGMSPLEQQRIFTPFTQITNNNQGYGLGLVISKKLIELLGGTIQLESQKGKGCIFTFTIKYQPYLEYEKKIEEKVSILNNKYVLIVDEDIDVRLNLSDILFEYKMKPIMCSSEKEAIKYITGKRYIFSIALLGITSKNFAKAIKDLDSEISLIAIIEEGGIDLNFEQVIPKPINKLKLLDTLIRVVEKNNLDVFELNKDTEIKDTEIKDTEIKNISILIAEDVSYNMDMLVKMLQIMGFQNITQSTDGVDTIKKLEEKSYDILLLDLKMPIVDGFSIAEHINQKKYKIKIVVITASTLQDDKERCQKLGIKYFLTKPFNMGHLKSILNRLTK